MTILKPVPQDRLEIVAALRSAVEGVMVVTGYTFDDNGTVHLRGRLKLPADQAYRPMRERMESVGFTPFLKDQEGDNVMEGMVEVTAMPGVIPKTKPDTRVNLWLFIATIASVIFAGTQFTTNPNGLDVGAGLMFGLTVMAILGAHEMGHYIVGRWRGAPVSLPYFIPLPLIGFFGTMGAVIVQREPFEDRRTLIEVGLAGPLAGFIVALPLLFVGLILTRTQSAVAVGMGFGDSLLSIFFKTLHFGAYISSTGLIEHPIYIAAWFGLLITGINLIPAGQLDGGHIAYAILGEQAKYLSYAMIAVFAILSFTVSDTWILWTLLLLVFGRSHPPSLNQSVKLEPIHFALAVIAVLVLVLAFIPNPLYAIG